MIAKESLDEKKEKVDIAELVSRYTELKPKGRDFWGCCPFHTERTPSFKVDPKRRLWHCFGCGEGGDVIDFVAKAEGLNFSDAVEKLASMAGMTCDERTVSQPVELSTAEKLRARARRRPTSSEDACSRTARNPGRRSITCVLGA